ncbi:Teichoic acids export ATP-binding protein TagH [Novipirellula galeiformis]|uniref:Teichoic acids export ATP-binding protein TagH n=1 Tax=Novipirellula galeiformis TaxID=2528004 RepID=A0A5C6CS11_9BACT|nr:ABC transporter ATP-binding protein [Novipirellula galeiformis]TWU27188.1 Teichoic acids export ATP-binding protein TagH [Novipirellula galeiformis]
MTLSITVNDLSKHYKLGLTHAGSIRELTNGMVRRVFHRSPPDKSTVLDESRVEDGHFWALKDVSFDVGQGEAVGIIGKNGAGKSTLLKILSQITRPTTGRAVLHGRVASLLEVGTGFHPELTGRENVYLNGTILGMRKREINRQLDSIVDFAGVEKFLDTPVKRYSSGMTVRLGFAVAAHLDPEILIVDEVLAVGDAEFQKRCIKKMQNVAESGKTVLFVSHNMAAIRNLCSHSILLQNGRLVANGATEYVLGQYLSQGSQQQEIHWRAKDSDCAGADAAVLEMRIGTKNERRSEYFSGESIPLAFRVKISAESNQVDFGVELRDMHGSVLFRSYLNDAAPFPVSIGTHVYETEIPANLLNAGSYRVSPLVYVRRRVASAEEMPTLHFQVSLQYPNRERWQRSRMGTIAPVLTWNQSSDSSQDSFKYEQV